MKKLILLFCLIITATLLVTCNKQKEISDDIIIDVSESSKFTKDEINNAIDLVKNKFSFPASKLTKIWYDEETSNYLIDGYLEHGNGSVNLVSEEDIIILLSNFYVDDSGDNPVLNSNFTYTDYKWILIRESKTKDWKIDDLGF